MNIPLSPQFSFTRIATAANSRARLGRLRTARVDIETPIFMPVGTFGSVRNLEPSILWDAGSRVLLANTYHLHLRPGPEYFAKHGPLQDWMCWPGSVLTDSGGFQIFKHEGARELDEAGATFRSYIDGAMVALTPETSIATQTAFGSDIMMVLDECIPSTEGRARAQAAMERTHRWALRSLEAARPARARGQALFAIVQGACFADLRRASVETLAALEIDGRGFDGLAIGGLAVGESRAEREDMTSVCTELLPEDKPRYLMGVGTPLDLLEAVHRGVDMFDCILPTALAEQGVAFTGGGRVQLRRGVYREDKKPLDPECSCPTCRTYSRAYLHQMLKSREPILSQLVGRHNIHFYQGLMRDIRNAIATQSFYEFYAVARARLAVEDPEYPKPLVSLSNASTRVRSAGESFEIVERGGTYYLRGRASNEVCHPSAEPDAEARALYVETSGLAARLAECGHVRVWDVGLGAGHNAFALLATWESSGRAAELELTSFELELEGFELCVREAERFPHLSGHLKSGESRADVARTLLAKRVWTSDDGRFVWRLRAGDFLARYPLESARPDWVFYDMFSSNARLWSLEFFRAFRAWLSDAPTRAVTYTASKLLRARMLEAGFSVAATAGVGTKEQSTLFATRAELLPSHGRADDAWIANFLSNWRGRPEIDELTGLVRRSAQP